MPGNLIYLIIGKITGSKSFFVSCQSYMYRQQDWIILYLTFAKSWKASRARASLNQLHLPSSKGKAISLDRRSNILVSMFAQREIVLEHQDYRTIPDSCVFALNHRLHQLLSFVQSRHNCISLQLHFSHSTNWTYLPYSSIASKLGKRRTTPVENGQCLRWGKSGESVDDCIPHWKVDVYCPKWLCEG